MPTLEDIFGTHHPVALVTGSGARRVGNVIARTLAARGYRVALHANMSRDELAATVEELRALTSSQTLTPTLSQGERGAERVAAFTADLTDETAARKLVDDAHAHFGRLDVLVNAAAIWKPVKLEQVTAAEVRRNFEINTLATFVCSQQAGLAMINQTSGGAIINIGDWAIARPYLDYAAYFPSKGAIAALTRSLAVELAARNPRVRVNCILPGPVMLPPTLSAAERAASIAGTLLKREGTPEHVASAVVFLAENDFVTGVCLPVDGGRTIHS
ncbi:MAG TPA: SDR family oxidoreductase [Pirellulaceae bacterium]|nr:SDR family oxidoreductase [Pirellulaceae bacterium]